MLVLVVLLISYLWWWLGNGCCGVGDSHCMGGRCNSFKTAIVWSMMCREYFGDGGGDCCCGGGGRGIGGSGGIYTNHYNLY